MNKENQSNNPMSKGDLVGHRVNSSKWKFYTTLTLATIGSVLLAACGGGGDGNGNGAGSISPDVVNYGGTESAKAQVVQTNIAAQNAAATEQIYNALNNLNSAALTKGVPPLQPTPSSTPVQ